MRSKRYMVLMFDDQASRWTQVAPKPSQDSPKMAPAWPKMAPSWTQVAPKRTIWLHKGSARANFAFRQGMHVLCVVKNAIVTSYKNHWFYKQKLEVGAPAMCSKRYTVLMFDDQASKWTQVAPKLPKIAPRWPQHGPRWPQVGPE